MSQITATLDQVTQKLQVRIDRVRENNETLISEVNRRQDEFQSEIKSTITALTQIRTEQQGELGGFGFESSGDGLGSGVHKSTMGGARFQGSTKMGKDRERTVDDPGEGEKHW